MRVHSRMGQTLAILVLLAPAAQAGLPIPSPGPMNPNFGSPAPKAKSTKKMTAQASSHYCPDCQRKKVRAETGLNIPPAPPLPAGVPVKNVKCALCGTRTAVFAGKMPPLPSRVAETPGRSVVDRRAPEAPAYAVSGNEPVPIGMVQPSLAAMPIAAASSAMPAGPMNTRDASVLPTSMASDPVSPPGHSRPHVLSHLFGLDAFGKERAIRHERATREEHASIPYGTQVQTVQDLPKSVVYGGR